MQQSIEQSNQSQSARTSSLCCLQAELAIKNQELAAATREAEKLLREISESTTVAEKEKHKVAVIVEAVSKKVGVGVS